MAALRSRGVGRRAAGRNCAESDLNLFGRGLGAGIPVESPEVRVPVRQGIPLGLQSASRVLPGGRVAVEDEAGGEVIRGDVVDLEEARLVGRGGVGGDVVCHVEPRWRRRARPGDGVSGHAGGAGRTTHELDFSRLGIISLGGIAQKGETIPVEDVEATKVGAIGIQLKAHVRNTRARRRRFGALWCCLDSQGQEAQRKD